MRALSILQPWAWAIAKGHKPVENREWYPPKHIVGQRIAVHASKAKVSGPDQGDFIELLEEFDIVYQNDIWSTMPYGAVVAVATVKGHVNVAGAKTLPRDAYRWFNGPYGWLLADVVELPVPVPAKGMLGLWPMPSDVETAVLHQVGKALAPDDTRLGRELGQLAARDPEVAAAGQRFDELRADILGRKR